MGMLDLSQSREITSDEYVSGTFWMGVEKYWLVCAVRRSPLLWGRPK